MRDRARLARRAHLDVRGPGVAQQPQLAHVRKEGVHALQVVGAALLHEGVEALLEQRLRVRREQRAVHGGEQRLARARVQIGGDAAALLAQPPLHVPQVLADGGGAEEARGLGGVVLGRALQQRRLEVLAVQPERAEHAHERVQRRALGLLALPLAPHVQQQPAHGPGEHVGQREEVRAEVLQPHVPQRAHARRLQRVGAVEHEEDGAQRQPLLAVVAPRAVHRAEEGGWVGGGGGECAQRGIRVPLALLLQPRVRRRGQLVRAEVLDRAVELLERALHRTLLVHGADGGLELAPRGELKVGGQRRRPERLDHQPLRRPAAAARSGLPRAHGDQDGGPLFAVSASHYFIKWGDFTGKFSFHVGEIAKIAASPGP